MSPSPRRKCRRSPAPTAVAQRALDTARPAPDDDLFAVEFPGAEDEHDEVIARTVSKMLHSLAAEAPQARFEPPPHNHVPAQPWRDSFRWSDLPPASPRRTETRQDPAETRPRPFILLVWGARGQGLAGAFYLPRRALLFLAVLGGLIILGLESVPGLLDFLFTLL